MFLYISYSYKFLLWLNLSVWYILVSLICININSLKFDLRYIIDILKSLFWCERKLSCGKEGYIGGGDGDDSEYYSNDEDDDDGNHMSILLSI